MNTTFHTLLESIQQWYTDFQWSAFWQAFQHEVIKFATSEQLPLAMLGVTAIFLSQARNANLHRYASIFGLLGQPFWFYMAFKNASWGVFVLCLLYTWAWGKGFKKFWLIKASPA